MGADIRRTGFVVTAALAIAVLVPVRPAAQRVPPNDRATRDLVKALAAGKLLVAARRLPDPNFARSIVLLAAAGHEGAMGLIVNRRTEVTLRQLFPHLAPTLATASHAFIGGPVGRTDAVALARGARLPAGGRLVTSGVHLLSSREALESLVGSTGTSAEFRVYVGHAGWGPGQLEAETAEGAWHVLEGDADVVFDRDPATVWDRQIVRTEGLRARTAPRGDRASDCSDLRCASF